jgi:hypothetical protein
MSIKDWFISDISIICIVNLDREYFIIVDHIFLQCPPLHDSKAMTVDMYSMAININHFIFIVLLNLKESEGSNPIQLSLFDSRKIHTPILFPSIIN